MNHSQTDTGTHERFVNCLFRAGIVQDRAAYALHRFFSPVHRLGVLILVGHPDAWVDLVNVGIPPAPKLLSYGWPNCRDHACAPRD